MEKRYRDLSAEEKKVLRKNVEHHQSIVKAWLFDTADIEDDDAMESLHWLSMYCWYSSRYK